MIYKKVRELNPADASYIAAFIDGEGTITLTRKNRNKNRRLGITICNGDYKLLKWVSNKIGAGQITKKVPYNKERHALSYNYQVYSQQALDFLSQILPYLKTYKLRRAKLVLKYYKKLTPRNGKYSKDIFKKRQKFIKSFFDIASQKGRLAEIIR